MRVTALAIASMLAVVATDVGAQGTKDYTGPLPPTNVTPLNPNTTPTTPNSGGSPYYTPGYGYSAVPQRPIYPVQRKRTQ